MVVHALGRWRRLSKDYEELPEVSEAMVTVAMIRLSYTASLPLTESICPPSDFSNGV